MSVDTKNRLFIFNNGSYCRCEFYREHKVSNTVGAGTSVLISIREILLGKPKT